MDYSSWAVMPDPVPDALNLVVKRYVWSSLAFNVSKMSGDYIDILKLNYSVIAEGFLQTLEDPGFQFEFKDDASDVEEALKLKDEPIWSCEEFYICTRTQKDSLQKRVQALKELSAVYNSKVGKEKAPEVARRYYEVDAVFRHVRNALSHACFRVVDTYEDGQGLFLFDINRNGALSCGALLSFKRLDDWFNKICSFAERDISAPACRR